MNKETISEFCKIVEKFHPQIDMHSSIEGLSEDGLLGFLRGVNAGLELKKTEPHLGLVGRAFADKRAAGEGCGP